MEVIEVQPFKCFAEVHQVWIVGQIIVVLECFSWLRTLSGSDKAGYYINIYIFVFAENTCF